MESSNDGKDSTKRTRLKDEAEDGNQMLPGIPMPSPELCLLNSRSPSCLYSLNHERSHRLRVRHAVVSGSNTESDAVIEPNDKDDIELNIPDSELILKDLKTYSDLLAYISVRLANKHNALEILGMDIGNLRDGYELLVRNSLSGVSGLSIETLIKTLQLRMGCHYKRGVPTDLHEGINNLDTLKKDLKEIISSIVDKVQSSCSSSVQETRASKSQKKSAAFADIASLPLIDNTIFSVISPGAAVSPDDSMSITQDLLGLTEKVKKGDGIPPWLRKHNPVNVYAERRMSRPCRGGRKKEKEKAAAKNNMYRAQTNKSAKNAANSKNAKSNFCETCGEKLHKAGASEAATHHCAKTDGAYLSEKQMLENLRDGKLCDGSDPMEPKDLVLSVIVAGLYEFLPVEFFNEFLQDVRLSKCFDDGQIDEETYVDTGD